MILALETSTPTGSIALFEEDGTLLIERVFTSSRSHSAALFVALEEARTKFDDIRALRTIVVGLGPGSYAGVRISIAAALGLRLASGAELLGIPSAAALDAGVPAYLTIGDARRDAYYYTRVVNGVCLEAPCLLTADDVRARLADLPMFATEQIPAFPEAQITTPKATRLGQLVLGEKADACIVQRNVLEPIYLREPTIIMPKAAGGQNA